MAEEYEIVRNANPSLVKQAQGDVGVVFDGQSEEGFLVGGLIKEKPNAKFQLKRIEEKLYDASVDDIPLPDKNPFSDKIKSKNDLARQNIIPLLNPMSKSGGIRLNSIEVEVIREINIEKAKPEPNPQKLDELEKEKQLIDTKRKLGDKGREGIVFPPRREGENTKFIVGVRE
tara:strand:+ start:296 stop:814 length:519 start_codon:yes stop_codon:yes gene_type:complete